MARPATRASREYGRLIVSRLQVANVLARDVATAADAIVVASEHERELLAELYGTDPAKVSVVPCGVDLDLFTPIEKEVARHRLDLKDGERIILFVGRIEPLKGIDVAVRARPAFDEKAGGPGTEQVREPVSSAGGAPSVTVPASFWYVQAFPERTSTTPEKRSSRGSMRSAIVYESGVGPSGSGKSTLLGLIAVSCRELILLCYSLGCFIES